MTAGIRGTKQHEEYQSYLRALFSEASTTALRERLNTLHVPVPYRLRLKVLYSRTSLQAAVQSLEPSRDVVSLSGSACGFMLRQPHGSHLDESAFLAVLETGSEAVGVVAAVAQRPGWLRLLRALRAAYPRLVPIFLSQRELLSGVQILRKQLMVSYEIRVRELSAREKVSTGGGRQGRSVREWTDEDLEQAIAHVGERRQTITSLTVEFFRRAGEQVDLVPTARCKITKHAQVELTSGLDLVWGQLVTHVAQVGSEKLRSFSRRGLIENHYRAAPLSIRYSEPVFDRLTEVRRLVTVLSRYPNSLHAVQHGNPYAAVQIADGYDGSAFYVWAVSPDRITIVPRLKATEAAVGRLVQYLFEQFREGRIEDSGEE